MLYSTLDPPRDAGVTFLEPGWAGEPGEGWEAFAASWNDLPRDLHMGDGGRYRRRRYARFAVGDAIGRLPHGPHYQERTHNALNGGIARWFAPIRDDIAASEPFLAMLRGFVARTGGSGMLEAHQFRIEAGIGEAGLPTPEGLHRDGRDWVLIALVALDNAAGGVSEISDAAGRPLSTTRLEVPGDGLLLDDRRVLHRVTPVVPRLAGQPATRDVLVLTLAANMSGTLADGEIFGAPIG